MLLRLTEGFAPSAPLPSPELERLRADVVLASVAVDAVRPREGADPSGRDALDALRQAERCVPRSGRRRHAFGLDPRLRAADLRAQERSLARRHSA